MHEGGGATRLGLVNSGCWGWRYGANCIDLPALEAFAKAHYAHGTEATCANGGYLGP